LFNLIRPEKESTPAGPPAIQPEAPATPKPGDEDAPPPKRLKTKEEEQKVDAGAYSDAPTWDIASEPCYSRKIVR
jgi:hypothetical protein